MRSFRKQVLSSFMVAGTAIGSGVLALPILAAGPGIINTLIFIALTFILAYKMAEVSLDVYARYDNHRVNAATLALDYFGRPGYILTMILNALSMGALAAAYINAGGDLLAKTLLPLFHIHIGSQLAMLIFFIVFMPAFAIGLGFISRLNGCIFAIKFALLSCGILLGLNLIDPGIFAFIPSEAKYLGAGASTMFCIWMMHMVLPLILRINDWNPAKAKKAVLIGLIIPAFAYAGWLLLIISLVSRQEFLKLGTIGDIMLYALTKPGVPILISTLVGGFAAITVLTAFLSIGFSLVAFVLDIFKWNDDHKSRAIGTLISFTIPVAVALIFPTAFVLIYQQSNMFQIAAAMIPIAAAYVYNKKHALKVTPECIMLFLTSLIILSQILDDLSIFPSYT